MPTPGSENFYRTPIINNQCSEQRDEETGYSYHGARHYDPSLSGIWLSVDPMADKFPGNSPYVYCRWNPIVKYDPNGMFDIKIHREIVKQCAINNGIGNVKRGLMLYGTGFHSDIVLGLTKNTHIDSRHDAKEIASIYNAARNSYKTDMEKGRYIRSGKDLHTMADFYSHSNYIEQYINYASEKGIELNVEDIPTFAEAQQDKDLWNYLEGRLETGDYSILDPHSESKDSHYNNNKDNPESRKGKEMAGKTEYSLHQAARRVAEKDINNVMNE